MQNLDWLSEQEMKEVEKIALEQQKTVGEVLAEMIQSGLRDEFFLGRRGPQSTRH